MKQLIKELREKQDCLRYLTRQAGGGFWCHKRISQQDRKRKMEHKGTFGNYHKELARFNPEAPLTMLFDYVKISSTLDIQHIIKDILKLNINYMLHEDYGHYSYTEHYSFLGDIFIYTSARRKRCPFRVKGAWLQAV